MDEMTVNDVIILAREYYNFNPGGGSLHIVLDDGNTEEDNVNYCMEYSKENGDIAGIMLARALLELSAEQRDELYERFDEYCV
jgi:hypothetical protein